MQKAVSFGMAGLLALALTSVASADWINGNFETGDFTGWTTATTSNGQTLIQAVAPIDIDGPGPIASSYAAQFSVGKLVTAGAPGGIELTQTVFLSTGETYRLHFDYAVTNVDTNPTHYSIDECGIFDLIVNGNSVAHGEVGELLTGESAYGALNALFVPSAAGDYTIGVRITRAWKPPQPYGGQLPLFQYVDNFLVPEPASLALLCLALVMRRR